MKNATVLVSHLYEPKHTEAAFARFPGVRFVRMAKDEPPPPEAAGADALLFGGLGKPALSRLLAAAPALRWIHTGSAGFDWVLVPEVVERGLTVSRTAGAMTIPMAEFAFAAMLSHAKHLPALRDAQSRRAWEPPMHGELYGRTLGVVGAGAIGARLAHLARAFGMRTLATKRDPHPLPGFDAVLPAERLGELLAASDVVVLACPLTPETRRMIGLDQLRRMKPEAYLINIARGGLIVTEDLVRALREGVIAGAWLDAFDVEPLPADDPLWDVPNLTLSPHCSYRSPEVRHRVVEEFAENLGRFLEDRPLLNTLKSAELGY